MTHQLRVILALPVLAACSPALYSVSFISPPPPAKPVNHPIRLYGSIRPECPFEEVGTVSSRKRNVFVCMEAVTGSVRRRAREMGGDAIVGVGPRMETRASASENSVVLDPDPVVSGTVIRFTNPECTH